VDRVRRYVVVVRDLEGAWRSQLSRPWVAVELILA